MTVVLLSGGLDSAVCLHSELAGSSVVSALFVNYGQRNAREEYDAARAIATEVGVTFYAETMHLQAFLLDALCSNEPVTQANKIVEGRNSVLLTVAAVYAKRLRTNRVVIGVTEDDFHDFPDCRPRFLRHMTKSLSLGLDMRITIGMPLAQMLKRDVVKRGFELECGDAMARSWSCYAPTAPFTPCRECPACLLRSESLA